VGILVANTFHLLSVVVLFRLSLLVWRNHPQTVLVSLLSAALHVVSPAGLFLSSPFAESSCALFSFAGYLLYAQSCVSAKPLAQDGYLVLAGLLFGIATTFRSNGILNGIPFAWEVLQVLPRLVSNLFSTSGSGQQQKGSLTTASAVRRLLALGVGGIAVAAGSLVPQVAAYQRFCSGTSGSTEVPRRPWCHGYLPSIYTFVQRHYW
jgi:GPI mannosyltransferase 2